jgi:hypothetical protein
VGVVDGEAGQVERLLVAGLPAGVGWQRAGQLDAVIAVVGKDLPDADVARVDQVDVRQQVTGRLVGVAVGHGVQVGGGGVGGGHVRDQVGPVGLAGLGEAGLVAAPVAAGFDAGPGARGQTGYLPPDLRRRTACSPHPCRTCGPRTTSGKAG